MGGGADRRGGSSGTTNLGEEKGGPARRDAHEDDPGPGSFGESEYARLYAPLKTDGTEFEDLFSNRQVGEGPMLSKKLIRGRPDAKEGSAVPYKQALPQYREAFEKAMNEGAIPAEYRDPVKKYFDTLNK